MRELMRLAIQLLDKQDGMPLKDYDLLKALLHKDGGHNCKELVKNVSVIKGHAFLEEDWVEENAPKYFEEHELID